MLDAPPPTPEDEASFDRAEVRRAMGAARRVRAMAELAEQLALGHGFEQAVVGAVRRLDEIGEWATARALCLAVGELPGGETAGRLGRVLAAHANFGDPLAFEQMAELTDEDLATYIPIEAVEVCLQLGRDDARARAVAIGGCSDRMTPSSVVGVAGRLLAMGETTAARAMAASLRTRHDVTPLAAAELDELTSLEGWLEPAPTRVVPAGTRPFGVINYDQPDQSRASRNIGDYVQTLAMLGNLARLSDVELSGEDDLGRLMTELQASVKPDLRLPGVDGKLHLIEINRDFSVADSIPPETFCLAFGWHMHSLYGVRYEFPYHPEIRPIFLSFHVNRPEMLTPEAIEYLRTYGPVGCRDWTTVDLLLGAGVDAFFSGCLTTTVDAVFPHTSEVPREADVVAVIDAPRGAVGRPKREVEHVTHGAPDVRLASLVDGVRGARELLSRYQSRYHRIITGRLHSYLPATSLGVPVRFAPDNLADPRFDGLLDLTPDSAEFTGMRDSIRGLLAEVFSLVADGTPADDIYAAWRERTAPLVEAARARFDDRPTPPSMDLEEQIAAVRTVAVDSAPGADADRLDIALGLDQNLAEQLPVTLEALVSNSTRPLRLWITCRGLDDDYRRDIAERFPDVQMTFLPCDDVSYGEDLTGLLTHTTVTTLDRLLLPELLPAVDRIIYVDIDALVLGDISELADLDLGGNALAARSAHRLGAQVWRSAGTALPFPRAFELWHETSAQHPFGYPAFNAGVLVLDLARMRADRFTQTFLPWVSRYGLNDQDVLLAYVGPHRAELARKWNMWPVQEPLDDPAVVHYLGAGKPWSESPTYAAHHWAAYQRLADERAARLADDRH